MNRTKPIIRLFGLCTLVFALMGIASSNAQAEVGSKWLVLKGTQVVEEGELVLEKDSATVVLHFKISGSAFLILCSAMEAVGINLAAGGITTKGGKINLVGCITDVNGVLTPSCDPIDGAIKGLILSSPLYILLVLHQLETGVKDELLEIITDKAGDPIWTIQLNKLCSIATTVSIIGKLFFKDCKNEILIHKETHLFEEGPLTELFAISKTEEHRTSLLGSAFARVKLLSEFRSFAGHAG